MNRSLFSFLNLYLLINLTFIDANLHGREKDLRDLTNTNLLQLFQSYVERHGEIRRNVNEELENWTGRWMPDKPGDPTPPPKVLPKKESFQEEYRSKSMHLLQMGHISPDCDDAKTNLTIDWNHSPINHTCYDKRIVPDLQRRPTLYCKSIPTAYVAAHKCMYETIEYDDDVPIYGTHRPVWPVYGEYKFLPKQRWLHSLEHGAVVMLYHPCANPLEVKRLKSLVEGCLWRHVITPYNLLEKDRPLALLVWGCKLTMSYVDPTVVKHFIRKKGLRGPEQLSDDGYFNDNLLTKAKIVTDQQDSIICPY